MGHLLNVYLAKVKIVLGAFKASKINLLLIFIYLLGVVSGGFGLGLAVTEDVRKGTVLSVYIDELSALISLGIAIAIIASFRGFIIFDYEESLFFTSTITPWVFLVASILSDLTIFSIFFSPFFVVLGVIAVSLHLPPMIVLLLFAVAILLILFLLFLKKAFSLLISIYTNSTIRSIFVVLIILLLLPAISLLYSFPIRYSELPYPSTFIAAALLHLICGKQPSFISLLGAFSCFIVSFMLLFFCSRRDIFRYAKSVPFFSPFDASIRAQTIKMGQNIRLFSKIGLKFALTLESESLFRFLIKKELIRMIRDGSLFAVFVFYIIVFVMSIATRSAGNSFPIWLFILAIYAFIVPAMLISNWRVGELSSLWIPLTSGVNLKVFFSSLSYALVLVSIPIPIGVIIILCLVTNSTPILPLVLVISASLIGSSVQLFVMIHFLGKKRKTAPGFMISWLSILLSGTFLSPSYVYVMLSLTFKFNPITDLASGIGLLVYSYLIFKFFLKKLERKILNIEI